MKKVHVQDLSLRVELTSIWKGWVDAKMKKRVYPFLNVTFEDFLKIIGNQTCKNFQKGKSTFTIESIKKQLLLSKKFDSKFKNQNKELKTKVRPEDKIDELNRWLQKKCPYDELIEKAGHERRLLIFSIEGPSGKSKKFYSDEFKNTVENLVLYHKRERKEILHLTHIDQELQRHAIKEPEFFRKIGPLWTDFENDYIARRKEVDEIIDKFRNGERFQLLVGESASGKSVVAKHVGYELGKEYEVYFFYADKFPVLSVDSVLSDVKKLDSLAPSLLVIDDVHRQARPCDVLFESLKTGTSKLNVLFVTRPPSEYNFPDERSWGLMTLFTCSEKRTSSEKYIFMDASEVTESIIKNYSEKNCGGYKLFDEVSLELKEVARENLWVLAYLLKYWKEGTKQPNFEDIHEEIYRDLTNIPEKCGIEDKRDAIEILLSISSFSQYEIPLDSTFLSEKMNLSFGAIEKLANAGEVKLNGNFCSIPHSSLAALYLDTVIENEEYSHLLSRLISRLYEIFGIKTTDNYNFPTSMFIAYLYYKETFDVSIKNTFFKVFEFNRGSAIYHVLLKEYTEEKLKALPLTYYLGKEVNLPLVFLDKKIQNLIIRGLKHEPVGGIIPFYLNSNIYYMDFAEDIDDVLVSKFENEDISEILNFFLYLYFWPGDTPRIKTMDKFTRRLFEKMEYIPYKIGEVTSEEKKKSCVHTFFSINEAMGIQLSQKLNIEIPSRNIEEYKCKTSKHKRKPTSLKEIAESLIDMYGDLKETSLEYQSAIKELSEAPEEVDTDILETKLKYEPDYTDEANYLKALIEVSEAYDDLVEYLKKNSKRQRPHKRRT